MNGTIHSDDYKAFIVSFAATGVNVPMVARWYGNVNPKITYRWENNPKLHFRDDEMRLVSEEAIKLFEQENKTVDEISNILNIHYKIVHVWVYGTYLDKQNGRARKPNKRLCELVLKDYLGGMKLYEIKEKYGICETGVRSIMHAYGCSKRSNISEEEGKYIIQLYKDGLTLQDIKSKSGRSVYAILYTINNRCPEIRRHACILHSEEEKIMVIDMYVGGLSCSQIESITGIDKGTIYSYVKADDCARSLSAGAVGKRAGKAYKGGVNYFPQIAQL